MKFVVSKDRELVAKGLKTIYQAATLEEAERNLELFGKTWDAKYPTISDSWRRNWARVTPFLAYPSAIPPVRCVVGIKTGAVLGSRQEALTWFTIAFADRLVRK